MKKIVALINELEAAVANKDVKNISISKSSINWHIDHVLIVINGIVSQLKKSNPTEFKSEFNLKRWIVFTTNFIPRGKANAPKIVHPASEATTAQLIEKIDWARKNISEIDALHQNSYYRHPYFKDLNVKHIKKFLTVHTLHHLKIIRAIVKQ